MNEILKNTTRSAGDLAGVFEFDGDTSYFYLYNTSSELDTPTNAWTMPTKKAWRKK
jgi:hypothetical protein